MRLRGIVLEQWFSTRGHVGERRWRPGTGRLLTPYEAQDGPHNKERSGTDVTNPMVEKLSWMTCKSRYGSKG